MHAWEMRQLELYLLIILWVKLVQKPSNVWVLWRKPKWSHTQRFTGTWLIWPCFSSSHTLYKRRFSRNTCGANENIASIFKKPALCLPPYSVCLTRISQPYFTKDKMKPREDKSLAQIPAPPPDRVSRCSWIVTLVCPPSVNPAPCPHLSRHPETQIKAFLPQVLASFLGCLSVPLVSPFWFRQCQENVSRKKIWGSSPIPPNSGTSFSQKAGA
jgi:hypothetical protein